MTNFWSFIWGAVILVLIASGLFDWIDWKFNIPAIIAVAVIWVISIYNSLVAMINRTKEAWADIDVQLKRRFDLIPNLIETVKGYAAHEQGTFDKVTEARTRAITAEQSGNPAEIAKAENFLAGALKSVFAVAEAYPDLKANQNFLELQRELSDTENKIQAARRFYNGNVRDLSIALQAFPSNIVGGIFGFKPAEYFDLDESERAAREPVAVKL
ncbi:MAG: LemA family protein [Candidatus Vogelbacteria bacterium]|nr:LemA family protein [Candidatus Vogelbacteria bacterium]